MAKIDLDAFYYALQENYDGLPVKRISEKTFEVNREIFRITNYLIYYKKQVIRYSGRPTGLIERIWQLGICKPYIGNYFYKLNVLKNDT